MKISIIVPIYNREKYLESCITSILNQTYKNIELILVDDGSKDKSLEICNKFKRSDKRIKVISQANKGVSEARNIGIAHATGEFMGFVDSDDKIDPDMYYKLINLAKHKEVDICISGIQVIKDTGDKIIEKYSIEDNVVITDITKRIEQFHELCGSTCQCLYRSSLIHKNNIKFEREIHFGEDGLFNLKAIALSKGIIYINEPLYTYIHHKESKVRSYDDKYWNNIVYLRNKKIQYLKSLGIYNNAQMTMLNRYQMYHITTYIKMIVLCFDKKRALKFIDNILKDKSVKEYINIQGFIKSSLKIKLLVILLYLNNKNLIYKVFKLRYKA